MIFRRWLLPALLASSGSAAAQTVALISDLNGRYGSVGYDDRLGVAIETIERADPAFVVVTGDMVAGQRRPPLERDELAAMWAAFNEAVADPLQAAGIPLAVTPGNHDGSGYPQFAVEREVYEAQWRGRAWGLELLPGSEWPRRYAARWGDFLLVTFDGTRSGPLPDDERDFVARMLAAHRDDARCTIVFSHLPLWPITRGREHEIIEDGALLDLLHAQGVDVFASGHHHAFYAGTDAAGMLHLSVGALGGNPRPYVGTEGRPPHGFALLTLEGDALTVFARTAPGFVDDDGAVRIPDEIAGPLGVLRRVDRAVPLRP